MAMASDKPWPQGQNRDQKDSALYRMIPTLPIDSLEDLHADGEDAIPLKKQDLELYKQPYEFLFVDFYASWCFRIVSNSIPRGKPSVK